jgi:DNA-binding response OmpR family regulator
MPFATPASLETGTMQQPLKALVVDDNRDFADSFAVVLDAMDCETEVAYDVISALHSAVRRRPQIVFLDLALGQENGSQVLSALRRMYKGDEQLTVACLTGHVSFETELACRKAGFDLFLMKPVSFDRVRDALAGCRAVAARADATGGDDSGAT